MTEDPDYGSNIEDDPPAIQFHPRNSTTSYTPDAMITPSKPLPSSFYRNIRTRRSNSPAGTHNNLYADETPRGRPQEPISPPIERRDLDDDGGKIKFSVENNNNNVVDFNSISETPRRPKSCSRHQYQYDSPEHVREARLARLVSWHERKRLGITTESKSSEKDSNPNKHSENRMVDEKTEELLKKANSRTSDRPPGSRNLLQSPVIPLWQKILFVSMIPIRAAMCLSLITVFFATYFGFILPVSWAGKLWPRLYWFVEGKLYRWLQSFIAYWGYTAGYDIYEYGDDVTTYYSDERVLLMCNHQSTADVPTLMSILQSKGVASRKTLWLMDIMFRWTPFGIIGNNHGDYFIQQGKATREKELERLKQHLRSVFWDRDRRWVMLFPEGGFYYKRIESSQKYGREHGFPHLVYTTLPRQGAVKAILEEVGPRGDEQEGPRERTNSKLKLLKDTVGAIRDKSYIKQTRPPIKYVLDATIAYPNGIPLSLATLALGTREKCNIAVHYKIYNADEVPFDDEEKLRDWMYKCYQEKDQLLANYYKTGEFVSGEQGVRVSFSWAKIVYMYVLWFFSFYLQWKMYSYILGAGVSFLLSLF